jgi:hypothetical protein
MIKKPMKDSQIAVIISLCVSSVPFSNRPQSRQDVTIGIPPGLRAMAGAQNRPIPITLPDGRQMSIVISTRNAGACMPLGHPDNNIDI